jgi:D-amino-acid dehydrogenase
MKSDVIIVGGGVIGLMSAYYLQKSGRKVTVIDKDDITNSASFGNAGLFSPFEKNPLSYPGVIFSTMKLMLMGKSPVIIHPSLNFKQYVWLFNFVLNANKKRLKRTLALFEKYGAISKELYKEMINQHGFDFEFQDNGLAMIYTQQESFEQKIQNATDTKKYEILDYKGLKKYIPMINDRVAGGVLLKRNAYMNPARVMEEMKRFLRENGVTFILNEEITIQLLIAGVLILSGLYVSQKYSIVEHY